MASIPSAAITTMSRASPAQASMVAPFTGLKSNSAFPATRKVDTGLTSLPSNGGRVQCMKVTQMFDCVDLISVFLWNWNWNWNWCCEDAISVD